MSKRTLRWVLVAAGCAFAIAIQAQQFIYKWTDQQGMIQYSELPPPTGVQYEMVRKPTGAEPGGEASTQNLSKEQENLAKQVAEQEKQAQEQAEQAQKEAQDTRIKNCEAAKKNIQVLQSGSPVVKTDEKGNKVALGTEQREAELKKAQKDQDYFCNP